MKAIFFIIALSVSVFASESPQKDLYKIDSRDWYFNHQGDYSINQPEIKDKSKDSDGDRLIREADKFLKGREGK